MTLTSDSSGSLPGVQLTQFFSIVEPAVEDERGS
jgi:hypothetical protein